MLDVSHSGYEAAISVIESRVKIYELCCEMREVSARCREAIFQSHKLLAEVDKLLNRRWATSVGSNSDTPVPRFTSGKSEI
jgi:hypothetical protein